MVILEALLDLVILAGLLGGGTLLVSWGMYKLGRWPR